MASVSSSSQEFISRSVDKKVLSREQRDGVGATVFRSIGTHELRHFDPFLMLDEFKVGAPAGFPDHPHRGFETVTFMFPHSKGSFTHEDFCGHKGTLGPGDLQWMTAGRGIVHSEIPLNKEIAHGLQLWINLAAKDKMCEPAYQELLAKDVPKVTKDGVTAAVIAGEALGVTSKVYTRTPTHYSYFTMEKKQVLEHPVPKGWNSFIYTISGEAYFGPKDKAIHSAAHHTLTFPASKQDGATGIRVETKDSEASFVILSGQPIGEPVVQHGPFVMNTREEIFQAFQDYQLGKNGFENAHKWNSENGAGY